MTSSIMKEDLLGQYRMGGDRLKLFHNVLQSATKLSFDSLIVNITELHVIIRVETDGLSSSELFDFLLTDDVKYELEWTHFPTFRPRYKVADDILATYTNILLELLKELCHQVETIYFGTCRFLDVSEICNTFVRKGTVKRLEILEWSGFSAAVNDKYPVAKLFSALEFLEVAASDSRNMQRRQSVQHLIELASTTGSLLTLKFLGADYTAPAFAPYLAVNKQLQRLELHRFKVERNDFWDEIFLTIREQLVDLTHLVIRDVNISEELVVYMYSSILRNNISLRKLTIVSKCAHPSFATTDQSLQLRQVFASASSLEEIRFESPVIHVTEVNGGSFLAGLLRNTILSRLEVAPCVVDVDSLVTALSRGGSLLKRLRLGSLHREVRLQDLELVTTALSLNTVLEDLSFSMASLNPLGATLIGNCLVQQHSLRQVSITINSCSEHDNEQEVVQMCEALARGIESNTSLVKFDLICRYGFHGSDSELMAPFAHALEVNKKIRHINLTTKSSSPPTSACAGRLKMNARGEILIGMNRLGREQFVDPAFQFCLWPKILAKISDPDMFYHTLQVSPTLVMPPTS